MLKQKSIDSIDGNYSMPMIVNVEENVEIDKQNVKSKISFCLTVVKRKVCEDRSYFM
jgi:hypothetical protein